MKTVEVIEESTGRPATIRLPDDWESLESGALDELVMAGIAKERQMSKQAAEMTHYNSPEKPDRIPEHMRKMAEDMVAEEEFFQSAKKDPAMVLLGYWGDEAARWMADKIGKTPDTRTEREREWNSKNMEAVADAAGWKSFLPDALAMAAADKVGPGARFLKTVEKLGQGLQKTSMFEGNLRRAGDIMENVGQRWRASPANQYRSTPLERKIDNLSAGAAEGALNPELSVGEGVTEAAVGGLIGEAIGPLARSRYTQVPQKTEEMLRRVRREAGARLKQGLITGDVNRKAIDATLESSEEGMSVYARSHRADKRGMSKWLVRRLGGKPTTQYLDETVVDGLVRQVGREFDSFDSMADLPISGADRAFLRQVKDNYVANSIDPSTIAFVQKNQVNALAANALGVNATPVSIPTALDDVLFVLSEGSNSSGVLSATQWNDMRRRLDKKIVSATASGDSGLREAFGEIQQMLFERMENHLDSLGKPEVWGKFKTARQRYAILMNLRKKGAIDSEGLIEPEILHNIMSSNPAYLEGRLSGRPEADIAGYGELLKEEVSPGLGARNAIESMVGTPHTGSAVAPVLSALTTPFRELPVTGSTIARMNLWGYPLSSGLLGLPDRTPAAASKLLSRYMAATSADDEDKKKAKRQRMKEIIPEDIRNDLEYQVLNKIPGISPTWGQ